jgi:phospholipase C
VSGSVRRVRRSRGSRPAGAGDAIRTESEERLAAEHSDEHLRRRDFLARTATIAGAAGLASAIPLERLLRAAADAEANPLPSPANMPIDTFVVLMMENRSFDHYFGWHPRADAKNAELSYPDDQGKLHPTHVLAPDFQGCGFGDPDHSWEGGRDEYGHGKLDGFLRANDEFAIGYYRRQDLPWSPYLMKAATLFDRYFCSVLGPTYVNRHYQWSAQSGGERTNVIPASTQGEHWETIFDRAEAHGISVRYYSVDLPFALLYGTRALNWIHPVADYYSDAAAGTLPNIAFVDPPFTDGGGGDGLSGDEHPHGDIRIGQAYQSQIVNAFVESPQWKRGAMFVNYDEWGGFFDHVRPVKVPDDRESPLLWRDFGRTGFRIPGMVVSPYARRHRVSHQTVTHESILKLISYRFRLGWLNRRHRYASNIGRSLDWANPNFDPPQLPSVAPPATTSCSAQGKSSAQESQAERREGPAIDSPEFRAYLDRLGYEPPQATPETTFRYPSSHR